MGVIDVPVRIIVCPAQRNHFKKIEIASQKWAGFFGIGSECGHGSDVKYG